MPEIPLHASGFPMAPVKDPQTTLEDLVRLLVDDPDSVTIIPESSGEGVCYQIRVAETDLGKLIGKQGRTAHALRTLIACHAQKIRLLISIDIVAATSLGAPRSDVGEEWDKN